MAAKSLSESSLYWLAPWWRRLACAGLIGVVLVLATGRALAQPMARQVRLPGGVVLAVDSALREAPAPSAAALPGRLEHFFTDGARQPLWLWVQSGPPQALPNLPPGSAEAVEQLAQGFFAGSSGLQDVRVGPYDEQRGAFGFQFQTSAVSGGAVAMSFSGVAFMTRSATVLALAAAPKERAAAVRAVTELLWQESGVSSAALLPGSERGAFGVGRLIGIVLGSLLGGFLLLLGLSWLLAKMKLSRALAIAISGLVLVSIAAVVVALRGGLDSVLQLGSYMLLAGVCHAWLPRWSTLARRMHLLRDERGLSTVEYVIILVLVGVIGIAAWQTFGADVRARLAGADTEISGTLNGALEDAEGSSASSGTAALGSAPSASSGSGARAPSTAALRPSSAAAPVTANTLAAPAANAIAAPRSAPAAVTALAGGTPSAAADPSRGGGGRPAAAAALAPSNSTGSPAPTGSTPGAGSSPAAAATATPASPPGIFQQAVDYVRDSVPVQTAIGVAYGTLQAAAPGGFIVPSPWSSSKAFEAGRGIGQTATGITQVLTGTGMMGGGGVAAAGGGVAAPATGGTSLVVSGLGVAVATEGVVVAGVGATNVVAGIDTLTNAVSMSGTPSGSPPGPTAAPAAGATPPAPPAPPAVKPPATPPATPPSAATATVPPKAQTILNQVKAGKGNAPAGYKGNKPFENDGRGGGQILPKADSAGKPITYKEYDVNPFKPGVNRGMERVVVGSDGKAYYTDNHYTTFTPMP